MDVFSRQTSLEPPVCLKIEIHEIHSNATLAKYRNPLTVCLANVDFVQFVDFVDFDI